MWRFARSDVRIGPDGALYIADWYNPIIQHGGGRFPRSAPRPTTHGRIWRVTAKGREARASAGTGEGRNAATARRLAFPGSLHAALWQKREIAERMGKGRRSRCAHRSRQHLGREDRRGTGRRDVQAGPDWKRNGPLRAFSSPTGVPMLLMMSGNHPHFAPRAYARWARLWRKSRKYSICLRRPRKTTIRKSAWKRSARCATHRRPNRS